MSGALAEAEALGRFGTEGVDYAYYWTFPAKNSRAYWAFRAYRNFDGKGAHFLDRSLTTVTDPSVSLFGSRDEAGKHLVLIALNLDPNNAVKASIGLPGCAPVATYRKFTYTENSQTISDDGVKAASVEETIAPYSINVFDVTLK
jgi:hypothetical protein